MADFAKYDLLLNILRNHAYFAYFDSFSALSPMI